MKIALFLLLLITVQTIARPFTDETDKIQTVPYPPSKHTPPGYHGHSPPGKGPTVPSSPAKDPPPPGHGHHPPSQAANDKNTMFMPEDIFF
ncbi:Contains similarity to an Extensin precursor from Daucus carota gi/119711 [Arabidopsis thaliana]|nr:Contains similarity to an Extensin precursor from Daucus carota gi/119711 [Arabidopsis thaliana]KAG7654278.1 hypothetical protein ISN44_As01g014750 [Arabidopsis suecica]CAA0203563.1 unnamed protein product [Arabidopsis thaliana]